MGVAPWRAGSEPSSHRQVPGGWNGQWLAAVTVLQMFLGGGGSFSTGGPGDAPAQQSTWKKGDGRLGRLVSLPPNFLMKWETFVAF